jgi:lysophospholipase L1-like esterase
LDSDSGVAVDNIAMRGRPWPGIRIADRDLLKQMGQRLDIGMIILQFGTNILPTETDNYSFYHIHFVKELQLLRKLLPDVPVLVIGVQAAAKVVDGELTPMKHARLIADAQKSAALACEMGFFDLHRAMGGTTGAVEWSKQSPSLMLSDYMHFSSTGAKIVGDRIWQAIDSLRVDLMKNNKPE